MYLPQGYTLHIETRDDEEGIWLCLDDGEQSLPIAKFVSEEAVDQYRRAIQISFAKAHTMGMMGI